MASNCGVVINNFIPKIPIYKYDNNFCKRFLFIDNSRKTFLVSFLVYFAHVVSNAILIEDMKNVCTILVEKSKEIYLLENKSADETIILR
jgi:hypothetical protein